MNFNDGLLDGFKSFYVYNYYDLQFIYINN